MNKETLNKLTPKGRKRIISLEKRFDKCEKEIKEIDKMIAI